MPRKKKLAATTSKPRKRASKEKTPSKKTAPKASSPVQPPPPKSTPNEPAPKATKTQKPQPGSEALVKKKSDERILSNAPAESFPVVGIGASAGGLNAFKQFLSKMPAESGFAFVLIPHLDPRHESLMAELLSRQTTMPVTEARQGMHVEPNHVYIIPPNRELIIQNGALHLLHDLHGGRVPIDAFFRSLADSRGENAVGIILSGTGSHGTLGLQAIKASGGLTMAQDPKSAEYDSMPLSAIRAGIADFVLPPEQMPEELIRFMASLSEAQASYEEPREGDLEGLVKIMALLRTRLGYDFSGYRKNMLLRRIRRRMNLANLEQSDEYLELLRANSEELQRLFRDFLIGVTGFFREPEAFEILQQKVLPDLVARAEGDEPARIWTTGCSTGEEAYSLAMLLSEEFAVAKKPANFKIFATDIDQIGLDGAREGIYPDSISADVKPERLRRFFIPMDNHFRVNRSIRDHIVFAPQNLLGHAPFSRIDMISCRNLLIYLDPSIQEKVIALFHFALREDGYLFLGPSESIGRHTDLFEPVSRRWRIFRRVGNSRAGQIEFPILSDRTEPKRAETAQVSMVNLVDLMRKIVLQKYAPASALINRKLELLCVQGPMTDYLEFPAGELTRDLFSMMRRGLRARVRALCQLAMTEDRLVIDNAAQVKRGENFYPCTVTVEPLKESKETKGLFLITFRERTAPQHDDSGAIEESDLLRQLEYELKTTREDLQSSLEEKETAIEELKASNEEVMSMNEELQSANVELESSKEELQSLNEELSTVNSQLHDKVDELDKSKTDLINIFNNTHTATILLDKELKIKLFTPMAADLLHLIDADVGRPLYDLAARIANENLIDLSKKTLTSLNPSQEEFRTEDGRFMLRQVFPYRTNAGRDEGPVEGVVIMFINISDRIKREAESRRFASILQNSKDAVTLLAPDGRILAWNYGAEQMFGYTESEALTMNIRDLAPDNLRDNALDFIAGLQRPGSSLWLETERMTRNGDLIQTSFTASHLQDEMGEAIVALIERDVSATKNLQAEILRVSEDERHRISRDLHDGVSQRLSGEAMMAKALAGMLEKTNPQQAEQCRDLSEELQKTVEEVRKIIHDLSPVDIEEHGLRGALQHLARKTTEQSGVSCTFSESDPVNVPDPAIATHFFRIAQEAVNNALKHSRATAIEIDLKLSDDTLVMIVTDDGVGLPIRGRRRGEGLGLKTMAYRTSLLGGQLNLERGPEKGTRVICSVPLARVTRETSREDI